MERTQFYTFTQLLQLRIAAKEGDQKAVDLLYDEISRLQNFVFDYENCLEKLFDLKVLTPDHISRKPNLNPFPEDNYQKK